MRSIFTLGIIFVFFLYALSSSFGAMLMYWWFAIFRPQDWMWWDVSLLRLPLVVSALFILRSLIFDGLPRVSGLIPWLMIIWLLLALIPELTAGCDAIFNSTVSRFAIIIICVFLTAGLLTDYSRIYIFILLVTCSLGLHAMNVGISSLLAGGSMQYGANVMTGTFSGSNAFSLGVAMVFCFIPFLYLQSNYMMPILPAFLHEKNYAKKLVSLFFILLGTGCIYTVISLFSRGSALALALGITSIVLLQRKSFKLILSSLLLGTIILAAVPLPTGYIERIESVFVEDEEERDSSAKSRPHFWKTAVAMADDNPLGVGIGCYPSYYGLYDSSAGQYGHFRSVHSSHFQILAEVGYLGLFIWFLMFLIALYKLLSIRKRLIKNLKNRDAESDFLLHLSISLFACLIVFLAGGAFYEFAHNEITWIVLILISVVDKFSRELEKKGADVDSLTI
jgi:putative inorganic carbon (HCO3(-)) transporter